MTGSDRLIPPALRGLTRPRRGAGPLDEDVYRRRRRVLALAVVAAVSLLIGLAVGASSATTGRPRHGAAPGTGPFAHIRVLGGAGGGAFAAAERVAESAAITRTLRYTPYVRIAGDQHREVALTFDDGPGPYTAAVLDRLNRLHAPATFFEVGVLERYFHAATSAIAASGYPIGDHTEDHAPMSRLSLRDQRQQILQDTAALSALGVPFPRLFRPPYGLWDSTTLRLLRRYRMLMVLWTVDTADYQSPGVGAIVHRAIAGARPGAIILLHDAGGNRTQTVAALGRIVAGLRRRGFRLVTVPRLLLDNPAPADQRVGGRQGIGG